MAGSQGRLWLTDGVSEGQLNKGKGDDGTVNGAQWTSGFAGGALLFDGIDDSVTLSTGSSLNGSTDFTAAVWIKTVGTSNGVIIIQQRNGGFNGQYRFNINPDGTLQFMLYRDGYQFDFSSDMKIKLRCDASGNSDYIYVDEVVISAQ